MSDFKRGLFVALGFWTGTLIFGKILVMMGKEKSKNTVEDVEVVESTEKTE